MAAAGSSDKAKKGAEAPEPPPNPFAAQNPLKSLAPMAVLYGLKGIDFTTNPEALFWLRVAFGVAQAISLLIAFFIYSRIKSANDTTEVVSSAKPAGEKNELVHEHDLRHLLAGVKATMVAVVVVLGMHLKFGYINPLILTASQGVLHYVDGAPSKLFKTHVLGMQVQRPFDVAAAPSWLDQKKEELEQKKKALGTKKSKKAD